MRNNNHTKLRTMDIKQKRGELAQTFETLQELNLCSFDELKFDREGLGDNGLFLFTDEQVDLYWVAHDLMEMADKHFEPERREAELEELRDQRAYLGSEGNH